MVRLVERQLRAGKGGELLAARLDRLQRGRAIDVRLAHAEQVQVGSVDDRDAHAVLPLASLKSACSLGNWTERSTGGSASRGQSGCPPKLGEQRPIPTIAETRSQ